MDVQQNPSRNWSAKFDCGVGVKEACHHQLDIWRRAGFGGETDLLVLSLGRRTEQLGDLEPRMDANGREFRSDIGVHLWLFMVGFWADSFPSEPGPLEIEINALPFSDSRTLVSIRGSIPFGLRNPPRKKLLAKILRSCIVPLTIEF